ncbi:TetR/AcrR family transcriptional regulator [Jiangella endophytica]|uniref:TetR/AcrR family transcriptional regulator n=1 Tax=Jiangella endophytica TaxID=1623398 RepID=UPI0013007E7C|nr:TetR/AcrR family transcriptional regulator [Jiangella endophytica]
MRSDTRRNRRRLLAAARVVLAADGETATMADVAAHAEISTATAYRHFPSMARLVEAVVLGITEDLRDVSLRLPADDADPLRSVMRHWVDLVVAHGAVLIQLRSRRGYLARLESGDPVVSSAAEAWRGPVERTLRDTYPADALPRALMLLNQISDPREIRDLHDHGCTDPGRIVDLLVRTFLAGLPAWLSGSADVHLDPAARSER